MTKFHSITKLLLAGTVMLIAIILFAGCTKDDIPAEQRAVQFLTGSGNRYWHIKEIHINNVPVALTGSQALYTKTYTRRATDPANTGSFTDSDGMAGSWQLTSPTLLTEIITNGPIGNDTIVNTLNRLSFNEIDMSYTGKNGDKVRLLYYGY